MNTSRGLFRNGFFSLPLPQHGCFVGAEDDDAHVAALLLEVLGNAGVDDALAAFAAEAA